MLLSDLMIQDLQTQALVRLVDHLNAPQQELLDALGIDPTQPVPDLAGKMARIRTLKARRFGISTIVAALYFCDTINHRERNTVIAAHTGDSAQEIFAIYKRFAENLPKHKQIPLGRSNTEELFWPTINSRISVATAGAVDVKSGATIHNLHKSEYAKWVGDVESIDASLNIACMYGNIIEETTARGLNHFFDKWQESEAGGNAYNPIFLPWFRDARNQTQPPEGFEKSADEERQAELYSLSDAQIYWYRLQKKEYKHLTAQEFPHNAREAFISSGNPVFDRSMLELWESHVKTVVEVKKPLFETRTDKRRIWGRLRSLHHEGFLKVWEEPDDDLHYLISADPAGGVNRDGKRDACSASAWCFGQFRPFEQVAHVHGHWEPHEFAWIIAELGFWYHEAMLAILKLNHGESVWSTLVHEVHYPANRGNGWGGLYYHNPAEISEKANDLAPEQRTPGWPENGGGKAFMIETLQQMVSDDQMLVNSALTVSQMFRYIHMPGGGMGGEAGSHDDCVSDAACGVAVYRLRGKHAAHSRRTERMPPPQQYGGYGNVYGRR